MILLVIMKKFKLLFISFIFLLTIVSCSSQYDGGIYTGNSMSTNQYPDEGIKDTDIVEEKLPPEDLTIQSTAEKNIENEDNYK